MKGSSCSRALPSASKARDPRCTAVPTWARSPRSSRSSSASCCSARLLALPPSVPHLRIDNPSKFDLWVAVTSGGHDGWMGVGSSRRNTTTRFDDVIDQGDVWIFRFSAQAESATEVRVTRSELESAGWQLTVPAGVSDDLRAQGAEFPP